MCEILCFAKVLAIEMTINFSFEQFPKINIAIIMGKNKASVKLNCSVLCEIILMFYRPVVKSRFFMKTAHHQHVNSVVVMLL